MRILRNLHRRVLNYRINFSIRFQLLISYQFSDEKRFRCRSNSIMSLAQTFITFVTANVLRFVAEELPRCTSTIWARSTHSRKVHLFAIPLTVRARARRSRTWPDLGDFPPSETKDPEKPGLWPSEWTPFSFSLAENRKTVSHFRLLASVFLSRVRHCIEAPGYPSSSKGDDAGRIHRKRLVVRAAYLVGAGISTNRKHLRAARRETCDSPCFSVPRNGRLSRAFRYREVRKGCEETGLSLPRTPVTFATFDIISSCTRSGAGDSPDGTKEYSIWSRPRLRTKSGSISFVFAYDWINRNDFSDETREKLRALISLSVNENNK